MAGEKKGNKNYKTKLEVSRNPVTLRPSPARIPGKSPTLVEVSEHIPRTVPTSFHGSHQLLKPPQVSVSKSVIGISFSNHEFDEVARLEQLVQASEARKQSFWEAVCAEIDAEFSELDLILMKIGLPAYNYRKDKTYPMEFGNGIGKDTSTEMQTCFSRLYLEDYIFPLVLPAIQSMILYAQKKRVFQSKVSVFQPIDYIVEYLYNNNSLHPERRINVVPISEIPFATQWLEKYPRPPYPKWLTMSEEEAVFRIQRCVRMWLARRKCQELRHKRDLIRSTKEVTLKMNEDQALPTADEIETVGEGKLEDLAFATHSQDCLVCSRFATFLQEEEVKRQVAAAMIKSAIAVSKTSSTRQK